MGTVDDRHGDQEWDVEEVRISAEYLTVCSLCGGVVHLEHDALGSEVWVHQN